MPLRSNLDGSLQEVFAQREMLESLCLCLDLSLHGDRCRSRFCCAALADIFLKMIAISSAEDWIRLELYQNTFGVANVIMSFLTPIKRAKAILCAIAKDIGVRNDIMTFAAPKTL